VFVRETGAIDNATYREINAADTLDASTHLRRLRDLKLLEKKGSGSRTYYEPGEAFVPGPRAESGAGAGESHQVGAQSREVGGQSREVGTESRDPDASFTTQDLPQDLQQTVAGLSKRPKEDALRGVIRAICAWRPVTSAQLASLLDRRQDPLVRDHLKPMVDAGTLRYTIPAMPNHPNQAYAAPSEEEAE